MPLRAQLFSVPFVREGDPGRGGGQGQGLRWLQGPAGRRRAGHSQPARSSGGEGSGPGKRAPSARMSAPSHASHLGTKRETALFNQDSTTASQALEVRARHRGRALPGLSPPLRAPLPLLPRSPRSLGPAPCPSHSPPRRPCPPAARTQLWICSLPQPTPGCPPQPGPLGPQPGQPPLCCWAPLGLGATQAAK